MIPLCARRAPLGARLTAAVLPEQNWGVAIFLQDGPDSGSQEALGLQWSEPRPEIRPYVLDLRLGLLFKCGQQGMGFGCYFCIHDPLLRLP